MYTVYVAGSRRDSRSGGTIEKLHDFLREYARRENIKIYFAEDNDGIYQLDDIHFSREIVERIKASDAVITFLKPQRLSEAAEAGVAGALGKRQLVVPVEETEVPKFLAGLEGVEVAKQKDYAGLFKEVEEFVTAQGHRPVFAEA